MIDATTAARRERITWGAGVTLLALALRSYRIGATNLWLDEIGSVMLARKSVPEILDNIRQSPHGPAYYLLLKAWGALFGDSPAASHALSAVAGAIVVLLVYRIGLRLAGESRRAVALAAVAAAATALSPVQLYFSQETRFHMVATALAAWALDRYLAWRALAGRAVADDGALAARPAARAALGVAVSGALALYAYPLSAFLVAALWVDVGLLLVAGRASSRGKRSLALWWLLGQGLLVLLCVPLLLGRGMGAVSATQVWRTALGASQATSNFLFYPVQQFQSRFLWWDSFGEAWAAFRQGLTWWSGTERVLRSVSLVGACVAVTLVLAAALRGSWRSPWRAVWLAMLVPLVAEAAISVRQSLELSRYALFAAPPLFLLIARGLLALPRGLRESTAVVLLTTALFGTSKYWKVDQRDSDYRLVAALLARRAHPGDSVVASPWYAAPAVAYYVPALTFTTRDLYRHGWASAGFAPPSAGAGGATGTWWLVVDYRGGDFYNAPVDSIAGASPFARSPVRVVFDTVLPSSIRVLKLSPAPRG